jgi:hypothetical protein
MLRRATVLSTADYSKRHALPINIHLFGEAENWEWHLNYIDVTPTQIWNLLQPDWMKRWSPSDYRRSVLALLLQL